jgi:hypothetical protein
VTVSVEYPRNEQSALPIEVLAKVVDFHLDEEVVDDGEALRRVLIVCDMVENREGKMGQLPERVQMRLICSARIWRRFFTQS